MAKQKNTKQKTKTVNPFSYNAYLRRKHVFLPTKRTVRLAAPKMPRQKYSVLREWSELRRLKRAQHFQDLAKIKKKNRPKSYKSYLKRKKVDIPSEHVLKLAEPKMPRKKFVEHLAALERQQHKKLEHWKARFDPTVLDRIKRFFKRNKCPKRVSHLARRQPRSYIFKRC